MLKLIISIVAIYWLVLQPSGVLFVVVIVCGCQFAHLLDENTVQVWVKNRTHTRWDSWRCASQTLWQLFTELQLSDHPDGQSRNCLNPDDFLWEAPVCEALEWGLLGVFGALPCFVDSNCMQDLDWAVLLTGNVAFMSVRLKKSMIAWTCRPNLFFSFSVLLISWSDMKTCCSGRVCM